MLMKSCERCNDVIERGARVARAPALRAQQQRSSASQQRREARLALAGLVRCEIHHFHIEVLNLGRVRRDEGRGAAGGRSVVQARHRGSLAGSEERAASE
jgi:hypothetical protein